MHTPTAAVADCVCVCHCRTEVCSTVTFYQPSPLTNSPYQFANGFLQSANNLNDYFAAKYGLSCKSAGAAGPTISFTSAPQDMATFGGIYPVPVNGLNMYCSALGVCPGCAPDYMPTYLGQNC